MKIYTEENTIVCEPEDPYDCFQLGMIATLFEYYKAEFSTQPLHEDPGMVPVNRFTINKNDLIAGLIKKNTGETP